MLKALKFSFARLLLSVLYRLIRAYIWTFRLRIKNEESWMNYLENGGTVLLCTWHQQFFTAIRHFKNYEAYNPALMISKSRDGDFIAGIAERSGWHPVRGSSSRDGSKALSEMIVRLKKTRLAAHIIDGPRGPSGEVKAGLIRLANATDAGIVPFYVSADRAWYLNSWDKFMLPKPFSRVSLHFGDMIRLQSVERPEDFEKQRLYIEKVMLPGLNR
jgi:lysophospholipid acyltransferase (LPLAT)-like uncharacterized protein